MEERTVRKGSNGAGDSRGAPLERPQGNGLVVQVVRFIAQNLNADAAKKHRSRCVPKRLVEGNGEHLGGDQDRDANFEPRHLAQAAEGPIDPVFPQFGNAFPIEKSREEEAVALLFFNKQLQGRLKEAVRCKARMRCSALPEAPPIRPLAKLELLNRPGYQTPFGQVQMVWV